MYNYFYTTLFAKIKTCNTRQYLLVQEWTPFHSKVMIFKLLENGIIQNAEYRKPI